MNIFYIILIFIPTGLAYWDEKYNGYKNGLFNRIGLVFLIILVSFRKNVGFDLQVYGNYYESVSTNNSSGFDVGFYFLNLILNKLGFGFNALLLVTSAFYIISIYYYISKQKIENKWFALFLYLGIFDIFVYSLAALRQSIAIAFYFFCMIMLEEKKYFKCVVFTIVGGLFHWSLFIAIPILLFFYYVKRIKLYLLLSFSFIIPSLYLALMHSGITRYISADSYRMEYYLIMNKSTGNFTTSLIWFVITFVWLLFVGYFLYFDEHAIVHVNKNALFKYIELDFVSWSLVFFLFSKICLALEYNMAFPRLQMYWYFLLPFAIPNLLKRFDIKIRIFIFVFLICLVTMDFNSKVNTYYDLYGNPSFGIW